jgi:biotin carboxylase
MPVSRVLLLLPTATYRASDFVAAARALGAEVVVASERRQALADSMDDRAVVVPLENVDAGVAAIARLHARSPVDAVVAVDDQGVVVAARAAAELGLVHNPPEAVAATRDKARMRAALAAAGVPQPRFAVAAQPTDVPAAVAKVGLPCVVKPVGLAASRGVIRADDVDEAVVAAQRVLTLTHGPLLVEEYVPGAEVAVEGLLRAGRLEVLAVFDKPDPLVGPFFEETIYVTPSRLPAERLARVHALAADAVTALGLTEGPVHAELRLGDAPASGGDDGVRVLEVAARTIGGLCARTLRFGAGIALEELVLRHALGLPTDGLTREPAASGVMMLPIPRAGVLVGVRGQDAARAVPGVVGLEITINPGRSVRPLPEGDRYLGFVFAHGESPAEVEATLRRAHAALAVVIEDAPAGLLDAATGCRPDDGL